MLFLNLQYFKDRHIGKQKLNRCFLNLHQISSIDLTADEIFLPQHLPLLIEPKK